jgi:GT2 family glycosyltransferase
MYLPHGFISYGGTLLPFDVIQNAEPPLEQFYVYADDAEYSFRISRKNYETYQVSRPVVSDIDHTFSSNSLLLTSFDKNVSPVKIFFKVRNQCALAFMTHSQSKASILINSIVGTSVKIMYAFFKLGINDFTIERSKVIIRAIHDGIRLRLNNEENIKRYTLS